MSRPALVFACAHLCDERLFGAQVDALGANTEALLAEIGLDATAVERLRGDGAI